MLRTIPGFLLSMSLATPFIANAAEPFRKTLTSVDQGIHLDAWKVSHNEVLGKGKPAFSVSKITLKGGKQEGVDLITIDNGKLKILVVPTRGMGILSVDSGDVRLGWESPVKEVVHPSFINLQSRGGLGWLEGFNEWMVRCGLESAGHPGKDKFINNVGDEAEMDLTLHGKIANIPASEVEVVIDRNAPHRIRVRGRVDERMFYGPKLELWTEISMEPGSTSFRIEDTVKNHGAFDQEFQMIYHANFGAPLLEKGAQLTAPVKRVTPFNAHAAKGVKDYVRYEAPTKGFIEQVYCLHPLADENKRTTFMLQNASGDRGVSLSFSVDQLPYVTLWKNTNAKEEGYVTGIEPGTGFPYNRRLERLAGRVPKLAPGASRGFTIDFTIHSTRNDLELAAGQIARIRAGRETQVDSEPVKVE
jgi:galactose mutarotase-like enzyme